MDYELCKKLKDAGFAFREFTEAVKENSIVYGHKIIQFEVPGMWYFEPTLSELIEACGDRFFTLYRAYSDGMVGLDNKKVHYGATTEDKDGEQFVYTGSTPEEAVALLYIK